MSDFVLPYISTLAFISFLIWIYTKEYRRPEIKQKDKLLELEAKVNQILAAIATRRHGS
jgi:hypothetical protein